MTINDNEEKKIWRHEGFDQYINELKAKDTRFHNNSGKNQNRDDSRL